MTCHKKGGGEMTLPPLPHFSDKFEQSYSTFIHDFNYFELKLVPHGKSHIVWCHDDPFSTAH